MDKPFTGSLRARGQATIELAAALPVVLALMAATLGLAISFSRHAILHYGVHMATRAAAASDNSSARSIAILRSVMGSTTDASTLIGLPNLSVAVTSRGGRVSVAATYLDQTNPLRLPSCVQWQLPVEKDVIR